MLQRTNAAIDREERIEAVEELKTLVEDWKGHRIEGFGDLLLHGQFTVLKGESISSKNEEREVGPKFLKKTEQVPIRDNILHHNVRLNRTIANLCVSTKSISLR